MLTFYAAHTKGPISLDIASDDLPASVNWIDAFQPTADDMAFLARVTKVRVPTVADLVEIEASSRLARDGDTLIMSMPAIVRDASGYPKATPIGFIVSAACVTTIRFERLASFDNLAKQLCAKGEIARGGLGATAVIIEIIIDHLADLLENTGSDLDTTSRAIFTANERHAGSRRPREASRSLTHLLSRVGRNGDLISKVSESLLGLSRMPPFIASKSAIEMTPDLKMRFDAIGLDARSLHEYQEHLASKTQFLLDTILGLANIEQNNVFRVLTVVSVIGIPPTFFASMYGMNFKTIPEYDWSFGYAYALTLIALSAIVPAVWFKVKGWW